jgi:dynein heavy chain
MLLVGHASSGKNTSIEHFFANISKQKYIKTLSSFSSQTTIEDALCIFERRIEKQRRTKNVVGPLFGKTNIIYINDISMAAKDRFGDQPAL